MTAHLRVVVAVVSASLVFTGCAHLPMAASPNNVLTSEEHMTLGNTYLAHKERNLAIQQYEAAVQVNRNYVPALVALGNIAFEERNLKKARVYFERAQKAAPKDPTVVNNLAMVRLEEGKSLEGLAVIVENALDGAGAAAPYLWDTLANIAIREGRYTDAENALKKAAETAPAHDPAFQKHLQESREKLASATPLPFVR